MNGTTFDALATARALREAGFDERQAEAVAEAMRHAVGADRDTLASKADLYRALWIQTGAIAGLIFTAAGLVIAAVKLL